jgi:hypothetical protein
LKPKGYGVLTCDYKPDYRQGDDLPLTDLRFYTLEDLQKRLVDKLENCTLVGEPLWSMADTDFYYSGKFKYSFATFVFVKDSE